MITRASWVATLTSPMGLSQVGSSTSSGISALVGAPPVLVLRTVASGTQSKRNTTRAKLERGGLPSGPIWGTQSLLLTSLPSASWLALKMAPLGRHTWRQSCQRNLEPILEGPHTFAASCPLASLASSRRATDTAQQSHPSNRNMCCCCGRCRPVAGGKRWPPASNVSTCMGSKRVRQRASVGREGIVSGGALGSPLMVLC